MSHKFDYRFFKRNHEIGFVSTFNNKFKALDEGQIQTTVIIYLSWASHESHYLSTYFTSLSDPPGSPRGRMSFLDTFQNDIDKS